MLKAYPKRLSEDDLLFFLHIPKTGGTSLTHTLIDRWGDDLTITPDKLNSVKKQPRELLEKGRLVYGHFSKTICRHRLPRLPNFTITFLRDPVSHYISVFNHLRRDADFGFTTRTTRGDLELSHRIAKIAREEGLRAFLDAEEPKVFDNFQTWYLVDGMRFKPNLEESEELLDKALTCLSELGAFGLTDRYNESLRLLTKSLSLDEPLIEKQVNAAPNAEHDEIGQELIEEIRYRTRYDQILYDRAVELFDERLADQ